MFKHIAAVDDEGKARLVAWIALHLSNYGFQWNWDPWYVAYAWASFQCRSLTEICSLRTGFEQPRCRCTTPKGGLSAVSWTRHSVSGAPPPLPLALVSSTEL